jgi:hypothetical protein
MLVRVLVVHPEFHAIVLPPCDAAEHFRIRASVILSLRLEGNHLVSFLKTLCHITEPENRSSKERGDSITWPQPLWSGRWSVRGKSIVRVEHERPYFPFDGDETQGLIGNIFCIGRHNRP